MPFHIGPGGPGDCGANPGNCPFGDDDNHYGTAEEARAAYEERLSSAYGAGKTLKKKEFQLNKKEQELREQNLRMAQQIVALRAQLGEVTFEDANPERAQRRLEESLAFAESRKNDNLVEKLRAAKVLPSGAFRLEDGSRGNVDDYLQTKQELNEIAEARDRMLQELNSALENQKTESAKFQVKTEAGSFNLSVGNGVDEKALNELPPKIKSAIMSTRPSLSMEAAREAIPPAILDKITTEAQVVDVILGKKKETATPSLNKAITGSGTPDQKAQAGLEGIAGFYGKLREQGKTVKGLNAKLAANNDAVKKLTAPESGPVFVPARSQKNGLVVTRRRTINRAQAEKLLTPEQLKAITVQVEAPDEKIAQTILSKKSFDRIFKATRVSLRVVEST